MLDFDRLASERAQSLQQQSEPWKQAVWSTGFQKLTADMSDGEVINLINLCPSTGHLDVLVRFLAERAQTTGQPPFQIITTAATAAGVSKEEWVKRGLASGFAV